MVTSVQQRDARPVLAGLGVTKDLRRLPDNTVETLDVGDVFGESQLEQCYGRQDDPALIPTRSAKAPVIAANALCDDADVPTTRPAAPVRRDRSRRIVRSENLRAVSLEPAQRCALVDRLYGVYSETVHGDTRDEFEAQVFGAGEVRLQLFYGARDELAGFLYAGVERMEYAGRMHAVFCAGVFIRLGYRGGRLGALFGLRQALRFKVHEPRTSLAYLTRSSSPAVYRLLASTMPRVYPSRRYKTPTDVEALVRAFSVRRQYVPVGEDAWLVRSGATPLDASRLRRLEHNPEARFYVEHNPRFAEGESLLVWIPLDAANLVGGFVRMLRARLTR